MTTTLTAVLYTALETAGAGESIDLLDATGEQIDTIPVELAEGDFLTRDQVKALIEATGRTVTCITDGDENPSGLITWVVEVK